MNRWIQIILFLFCGLFVLAAILLPALGVFRVDGILVLYILGIILLAVSILLVALMWPPSWWVWLMLGIGVIFTLLSILGSNLWGWGMTKSSTPADIDPVTEITPNPPTPLVKEPVPNVGQIFVDGQETGVILDDGTVAITNGRILCNHDAPYDTDELAIVESTWVDYQIQTQKGEFAVVFGYGIKVGDTIYSPGAIILVASNGETAEISVLNGEVIIWNDISKMHSDIENRISDEIKNGNMTIKGPLAFKYVSQEFRGYIPQELFDTRQIEIVPTH